MITAALAAMSHFKSVGPITVEVEPGKKNYSPVYRNVAAKDGLPETFEGASTLYEAFNNSVERFGDCECIGWRPIGADGKAGAYEWLTYKEVKERALWVASALSQLGFKPHDKLGLYSANKVEWMLTMRGVDVLSGTIVPVYDSLGESAVQYIVNHSEATIAVVESSKLAAFCNVLSQMPGVKTLVYIGAGVEAAIETAKSAGVAVYSWDEFLTLGEGKPVEPVPPKPEDVCSIMYTSGTTGVPKGVMQTHRAMVAGVAGARNIIYNQTNINLSTRDSLVSFLPLAHIFERIIEELALDCGTRIGYWQGNVKLLMDDVQALRPTLFIAVPRILERVCDAVEAKLRKAPKVAQAMFGAGFGFKSWMLKHGVPHAFSGLVVDQVVFKKMRAALGGRVRFIVSGGAPLAPHVEDFCNICLAPVLQGYGLTETCAASFIMLPDPRLAYTVGPPLAATEFRLESVPELKYDAEGSPPKGEICIRGPMVFAGYYKDPEKTKAEFDEDGFFHSGDIGMMMPNGCLKIIDRKKNIFKLAQGEYIAVEHLENVYGRSAAVEQIWVYGTSTESSLVAVVVPQPHWWDEHGGKEAAGKSEAQKAMLAELSATGKAAKLKGFEMVRAVHLETEPFSVENELLTPSMKLKRPQLTEKYLPTIDALYADLKKAAVARG